jgi:hypothetical protein
LRVTIPPNASAKVVLPAIGRKQVTEGGSPIKTQSQDNALVLRVGSGTYNFEVN